MAQTTDSALIGSKPHYLLLDALRGVAALCVMWYHVFEAFATTPYDQGFNHGYMAVDFFFILSGFVIGYAYDDRFRAGEGRMTTADFIRRRFVRLHPMMVAGALIGLVTYVIQGCVRWDGTHVEALPILIAVVLNLLMLPVIPGTSADVRGNTEMYPLNGPSWSLFFEYIGNLLYVFLVRRLSTRALTWWVVVMGAALAAYSLLSASGYNHIGVGWSLTALNFPGGLLRVSFSMSLGLLLSRRFRPIRVKGAFVWCAVALVLLFAVPYVSIAGQTWVNSLYEMLLLCVVFPLVVVLSASARPAAQGAEDKVCRFLGDVSYPLYAVHYPFMYLFYAWVWKNEATFAESVPVVIVLLLWNIVVAYLCWRFYDVPVRRYLSRRVAKRQN